MQSVHPDRVRIEASSYCQLRCPSCPTAIGTIDDAIGRGFLTTTNFSHFLDSSPDIREAELSNYGETLLNPQLPGILAEAHRRGIVLRADNGVNLNRASEEVLDALVRYRLRSLTCSIDGAKQETYRQYRVRGSLDNVIENIEIINARKKQHGSVFPIMTWQFIAFEHNAHEITEARAMARDLGMRFKVKLAWSEAASDPVAAATIRKAAGAASRVEFASEKHHDYMEDICLQLWQSPQINWDGRMLGCCRNFWGDFGGNAFENGIDSATNSEKMTYARAMLDGSKPARDDIPCFTCEIYHSRTTNRRWVSEREIALRHVGRSVYRSRPVEWMIGTSLSARASQSVRKN